MFDLLCINYIQAPEEADTEILCLPVTFTLTAIKKLKKESLNI